jgi:hypothetical protein
MDQFQTMQDYELRRLDHMVKEEMSLTFNTGEELDGKVLDLTEGERFKVMRL